MKLDYIYVNDKKVNYSYFSNLNNKLLLQVLLPSGYQIPRFCYHEKLPIAGIVECV